MYYNWPTWRIFWTATPNPTTRRGGWSVSTRPPPRLLADVSEPLPAKPGRPKREAYEYRSEGTRNLFPACEPLAGGCHGAVTKHRTTEDFAQQIRWLVDEAYPDVPLVRVVLDNLNT